MMEFSADPWDLSMPELRAEARMAASEWHNGQWSALYAFASSGTVVLSDLAREVRQVVAADAAREVTGDDDFSADVLAEFVRRVERSIFPGELLEDGDCLREWGPSALRSLIDEARERAASPGRICDPMAYIMDRCCDPNGDETVSMGLGGDYVTRFGRRLLVIDGQGFVASQCYRTEAEAVQAVEDLRRQWAGVEGGEDG